MSAVYWNFGQIYQQIRKEKGISQEEVCGNVLSRTTLSKIENGHTIPSYDLFSYLLMQINMSFEEFEFVCNEFQMNGREDLMIQFENLVSNSDVQALEKLKEDCRNFLEKNNDCGLSDLISVIDALTLLHESEGIEDQKARELLEEVWQKLSVIDTWYYHEICLINCLLVHFPIETVVSLAAKLVESVKKYQGFTKTIDSFCVAIYTNLSTIYLHHERYEECLEITEEILKLAKHAKRYDFYCLAWVRIGICTQNAKKIQEGIRQLEFFGESEFVEEIQKEVQRFSFL